MPTSCSRFPLALVAALALPPALRAAEPAPGVEAAAGVEPAATKAKRPGRGPVPVDPMQDLRDRLAAKLGATRPNDGGNDQELRVSTQPDGELRLAATVQPAPRQAVKPKAAAAKASGPRAGADWSYDGEAGPQAWGRLKPEFSKCASGARQSPIDIRDGIRVDLDPVQFDYKPSTFGVLDNGHTVQVNVAPGNFIEVMGRRFELAQFHFHRPSEERIDGKPFDMAVHLVHKELDGRLAVVAVLLERGSAHPLVQSVWNNLPLEKGDEVSARTLLDLNQLLPRDTRYFTYMGSLTTPPCSEGVLWMVMQQPVSVSAEQIDVFARLYPMNARPLQQAAGRLIKQSN
ncbi:MAG TPA: carbonic anhydrase family protein [Burkholderiaceae bacterium]